jgi:predicted PurR-regulated permease PerM
VRWDRAMIRGRLHRAGEERPSGPDAAKPEYIEIDPSELTGILAVPQWLRDVGMMAWLLVGVAVALVGAVWLIGLTDVITAPVITAAVVAAVASPMLGWMSRHRVPRAVGAVLTLLLFAALAVGVVVLVVGGITGQRAGLADSLGNAKDTLGGWLEDIGVDPESAAAAKDTAGSTASSAIDGLLSGVISAAEKLSSLAFFLALTALSLFFLLKDGPQIRAWGERHLGVPMPVARVTSTRVLESLRGYFLGVTIVAAFNGVVVMIGALLLGVPLAGTIGAVTFVAAYVPYLGAWTAATFSVLLALGGSGPEAAGGMVIVQLLANGVLQQMVQPFAMGAALGIHPLAVLIVTIGGGALFGAVGLVLAAPLTAAGVKIAADLARARERDAREAEAGRGAVGGPSAEPAPGTT